MPRTPSALPLKAAPYSANAVPTPYSRPSDCSPWVIAVPAQHEGVGRIASGDESVGAGGFGFLDFVGEIGRAERIALLQHDVVARAFEPGAEARREFRAELIADAEQHDLVVDLARALELVETSISAAPKCGG